MGRKDTLEKGTATHSSVLAWRIPMDRGSLMGYSPRGRKELDTTEQLSLHYLVIQWLLGESFINIV